MIFKTTSALCVILYVVLYVLCGEQVYLCTIAPLLFLVAVYIKDLSKCCRSMSHNYANPIYILILSMLIVNIQRVVDFGLNICTPADYMISGADYYHYMPRVYYLALVAITFLLIGLHKAQVRNPVGMITINSDQYDNKVPSNRLLIILIVLFYIGFVLNIDVYSFISGAEYHARDASDMSRGIADFFETYFNYLVLIYVSVIIYKNQMCQINFRQFVTQFPVLFWIIFISYILLRGLSGDRGPLLYNLILICIAYIKLSGRRFRLIPIVLCVVCSAFMMNLLNNYRGSASEGLSIESRVSMAYDIIQNDGNRSIAPFSAELANSINCNLIICKAMDEGKVKIGLGKYSMVDILQFFPGSNTFYRFIGVNLPQRPGTVINELYWGSKDYYISLGSTAISALFLDFGFIGVCLGFYLLGLIFYFVGRYFSTDDTANVPQIIALLYMAQYAVYIPRFTFIGPICSAILCVIIYYVISCICNVFSLKSME